MRPLSFDVARTRTVIDALDGKGFHFVAARRRRSGDDRDAGSARAREARRCEAVDPRASRGQRGRDRRYRRRRAPKSPKLRESLPLLDQQLAANEQLLAKGYVSKLKVLDMRRQRIAETRDYDAALQAIRRASAQAGGATSATDKTRADMRAELLDAARQVERRDAIAARRDGQGPPAHSTLQALRAPVAGTIGQLAVHTEGGVVEAAKPIMTVVPGDGKMVAEVKLLNRDAGFVAAGQKVQVKLDAFPFVALRHDPGPCVVVSAPMR